MKPTSAPLFVSPVWPSTRGNGLAMRAAATLRLLAQRAGPVHLLVVPMYGAPVDAPEPAVAAWCRSWQAVPDPGPAADTEALAQWRSEGDRPAWPQGWRSCHPAWQQRVAAAGAALAPSLILVFRFYLWPHLEALWPVCPQATRWLDLDEMESTTLGRLADLHTLRGQVAEAARLRDEAQAYATMEAACLPQFDRVWASSALEAAHVRRHLPASAVAVLPNTVKERQPCAPRASTADARLLFVGTLGYLPNRDAVEHFCAHIWPLIRAAATRPVTFHVVGKGPAFGDLGSDVVVHGFVDDLTPLYTACDVVVVPLRAGGGTRIKILEAFSHQRPVVSTPMGAEGLLARSGEHWLLADTDAAFAQACLHLLAQPQAGLRLAEGGYRFFREHHAADAVTLAD